MENSQSLFNVLINCQILDSQRTMEENNDHNLDNGVKSDKIGLKLIFSNK